MLWISKVALFFGKENESAAEQDEETGILAMVQLVYKLGTPARAVKNGDKSKKRWLIVCFRQVSAHGGSKRTVPAERFFGVRACRPERLQLRVPAVPHRCAKGRSDARAAPPGRRKRGQ